jgi:hypothetical protein
MEAPMSFVMASIVAVGIWAADAVSIWAADLQTQELGMLAKRVDLPPGATEEWDGIGTISLKGEKADTTIKLYSADSDSIADKEVRKGSVGIRTSPNFFSIHAVYRDGDGPWKYKELYGAARVGFLKVAEVKPDSVTIQVQSKAILWSDSPVRFTNEELKRIYEPVSLLLTLKNGVPSLK